MKRIKLPVLIAAIISMAFLTQNVNAQSPVSFGIKGGLNISNFHGSDAEYDASTGLMAGAVLDFSLPALPMGIESGVYYTQKGAEANGGSISLDYIEVPVLAKVQLGPPGPIKPHLVIGPHVGFNINAEDQDGNDVSDFFKGNEFGGTAGVGLDFSMGLAKLNAQARYSYGFTSVYEDDAIDSDRNAVFTIALGIMF